MPTYDLQTIKERIDLIELFKRDGHEPRRMGTGWFVRCPFHDEKSGSCKVEARKFHCFGCGVGSDVFDYWERSRGMGRKEAIEQLATLAGIAPQIDGYTRPLQRPAPRPQPEEIVPPLTAAERDAWFACVDDLRGRPRHVQGIADWRGIGEDVVRWALDRGIIGIKKWHGMWREAFLVEMPESIGGPLVPVSTHIRLGPNTKGNDHPKASWRFDPHGRGSWPLVIGDPATAKHIFLLEGQWDGLALVHLMRWHIAWPDGLALVAMRGATSFRKFLTHYAIHEKSTVFAIADADNAGSKWFEPDGLVHQLGTRVARIHAFWPGTRGADFNDLVKQGLTRDQFTAILRPKLHSRRHRKAGGPTFLAWCKDRLKAPDPVGKAAKLVLADDTRPTGRVRKAVWERHWRKLNLPDELTAALSAAWETYKSDCTPT